MVTTFFHVAPTMTKSPGRSTPHGSGNIDMRNHSLARYPSHMCLRLAVVPIFVLVLLLGSCARQKVDAAAPETGSVEVTVGTVPVITRVMADHLTLSSELVPFQEI